MQRDVSHDQSLGNARYRTSTFFRRSPRYSTAALCQPQSYRDGSFGFLPKEDERREFGLPSARLISLFAGPAIVLERRQGGYYSQMIVKPGKALKSSFAIQGINDVDLSDSFAHIWGTRQNGGATPAAQ
jgi:hypothetical protein